MGFMVEIASSDESDGDLALEFSADYQLESYDAIHLTLAETSGCQFLITFDGDFNTDYYDKKYNSVKIILPAS